MASWYFKKKSKAIAKAKALRKRGEHGCVETLTKKATERHRGIKYAVRQHGCR